MKMPLTLLRKIYRPGKFLDPATLPLQKEPSGTTDLVAIHRTSAAVRSARQAARDNLTSLAAPYGWQPTTEAAARWWPGTRGRRVTLEEGAITRKAIEEGAVSLELIEDPERHEFQFHNRVGMCMIPDCGCDGRMHA